MSDFAQTGLISTLQRLNETHLPQIEAGLEKLARARPIALVLPCHGSDLQRPALAHIVAELSGARFLREIVVSMNAVADADAAIAREAFAILPQRVVILRNDSSGKGGNVAAAFRHLAQAGDCAIVATQDCDVASFRRADLARLCHAVADPHLGYRFAKMYYSRVTDRLYGRVSRLFLAPLLHALVRVVGHQPLLDFLLSFRYPLAGEVAMTCELASALPEHAGWSLEIGQLCEIFRRVDPREVCQVQGGTGYDHRHQPAATALAAMAGEIACELLRQCAIEGTPAAATSRATLAAAYRREAAHALRRSAHLASINALPFDAAAEEQIVAAFASQLDHE